MALECEALALALRTSGLGLDTAGLVNITVFYPPLPGKRRKQTVAGKRVKTTIYALLIVPAYIYTNAC